MRHDQLAHRFVRSIPKELEPGVLYMSMEYATAIHSCCCGCGSQVVTPLSPTDWQMSFDGESISLSPSIGNWSFPCRSHYFIKKGKIVEAGQWESKQVEAGRKQDRLNKARFYQTEKDLSVVKIKDESNKPINKGLLKKLWLWIFSK